MFNKLSFLILFLFAGLSLFANNGQILPKQLQKSGIILAQLDNENAGPRLAEAAEREELFKNLEMPDKCPRLVDTYLVNARKRYSDLAEMYDEIGKLTRERNILLQETDEKRARRRQKDVEKLDKSIYRLKRNLVKAARRYRRPLDQRLAGYLKEKEASDKRVADAEAAGNEKRAQKIAQDFAKKGNRIQNTQQQIDFINYFLFWDKF